MELFKWSTTSASNNASVPDGAPDGWTGANVNEWARETMASVRAHARDAAYIDETYQLSAIGTKSLTRISATQFKVLACDATAYFTTDRRIRIVGATTDYGFVTSSSYSAPDTTVNVTMDSADVPTSPTQALVHVDSKIRGSAFKKPGTGNGLDADTVDGIHAVGLFPRGLFHGRIVYATAATVTIERGFTGKILCDIDGTLLESSSDLTVDLSSGTDREDASEAASTWYYLYLYSNSGVLTEKISSTAPNMTAATKLGYHPTNTGWRCIGAVWNNASSNIQPFDYNVRSGLWMFRQTPTTTATFRKSVSHVSQTTYAAVSFSGAIPATARTLRVAIQVGGYEDAILYYGHESLSGLTVSSNTTANVVETSINGGSGNPTGNAQFDIAVDSTPSIVWGNVVTSIGGTGATHNMEVAGWYDDLGIVD